MMSAFPQKTLKVVPAPLALDAVDDAPPVWEAVSPTVEYTCGNCGAVLMRANEVSQFTPSSSTARRVTPTIQRIQSDRAVPLTLAAEVDAACVEMPDGCNR